MVNVYSVKYPFEYLFTINNIDTTKYMAGGHPFGT